MGMLTVIAAFFIYFKPRGSNFKNIKMKVERNIAVTVLISY